MLKNHWIADQCADYDQIIPINGMLKNHERRTYFVATDQIIPINGMLKNVMKCEKTEYLIK